MPPISLTTVTYNGDVLSDANGGTVAINGTYNINNTEYAIYGSLTLSNAASQETFHFAYTEGGAVPSPDKYLGGTAIEVFNTDGSGNIVSSLTLDGDDVIYDAQNGNDYQTESAMPVIETNFYCFKGGTRLLTDAGYRDIEDLQESDIVITASGSYKPVRWIGRVELDCNVIDKKEAVWPIRILAGAFGKGVPLRDLYLSPQHAVAVQCLTEVLIPIKHLINDATVKQIPCANVRYFHVELDEHDILIADGLPAESFLETLPRSMLFDNGFESEAARPVRAIKTINDFCRPLVQSGPIIHALRSQLADRAQAIGWTISRDPGAHLVVDGTRIEPIAVDDRTQFLVPSCARSIILRSNTFIPKHFENDSEDDRTLGLPIRSITIDDKVSLARQIQIDDIRLVDGFHIVEKYGSHWWRWTNGEAVLDADLWQDMARDFVLSIGLTDAAYFRRWVAHVGADSRQAAA